ncbi:MAG: monofunctional biosynthetic peptidoglycan transglycosylase [Nitrospinae bacterium]|nr:monofunctional biosynthetic peptidoglycan transglycosylase [Nitrospinota bacterium]
MGRYLKWGAWTALTAFCIGAAWIGSYFVYPDVSSLKKLNPQKTAFMAYREEEAARKGKNIKQFQRWVPLSRISPFLADAVLIAEDDKFWQHEGFDIEGMQEALEKDIKAGKLKAGGSTITQQLAKNLFLSPEKSPVRKIKEAVLTWRLERSLSKRRILELYLNVAEWGDGVFGAEAAAQRHFGKSASQLSPEEAARLAAVLPNPRRFNAAGNSRYVANRVRAIYAILAKRDRGVSAYEELMKSNGEE